MLFLLSDSRSGATNISTHMVGIDYTESNRRHPGAPVLETECLATLELDSKTSIASVLQDASTRDLKNGNCIEQVSCDGKFSIHNIQTPALFLLLYVQY